MSYKDFYQDLVKHGVLKNNDFDLELVLPKILQGKGYEERLILRCEGVPIITPTVSTTIGRLNNSMVQIPINREMDSATFTFLSDKDMSQHGIISSWMDYIFPKDNMYVSAAWYDDYVSEIRVIPKSYTKRINETIYVDAFPIIVPESQFSKINKDEVERMTVTFAYRTTKSSHA